MAEKTYSLAGPIRKTWELFRLLVGPEVPPTIRAKVLAMAQPGDQLWRCPRLAAPRGALGWLGVGRPRDAVIEWWLLGADGELIEAFWEV